MLDQTDEMHKRSKKVGQPNKCIARKRGPSVIVKKSLPGLVYAYQLFLFLFSLRRYKAKEGFFFFFLRNALARIQ
jgi:hypothetical protein